MEIKEKVIEKGRNESMETKMAYGVDLGWLSQLEARGIHWVDAEKKEVEPLAAMKEMGVDAVRFRIFVNPPKDAYWRKDEKTVCMLGFCDGQSVLEVSKRVKEAGMKLMLDFHYSDHFADPQYQDIPEEWTQDDAKQLTKRVYQHTKDVMTLFVENGVTPEWVQVGNETTPGMMLPAGSVDNPKQLTALNNAGYDAVKAVFPDAKVIVHLDSGQDQWRYDRMFDILRDNGGRYDMIGMSLYPYWAEQNGETGGWRKVAADCKANIDHVKAKYGKPVMLCEIGMPWDQAENCKALLSEMMTADVEGIFYWEPQAPSGYNGGYQLGCFDNDAPTVALDPFMKH